MLDIYLPINRRAFCRVLFCRFSQHHVEHTTIERGFSHVDFLLLEVNVVGHNLEFADAAVHGERLDEVGCVDAAV